MALIPETASDSLIAKLFADHTAAALSKILDTRTVACQIDATVEVARLARALASEGLVMRSNPETQCLYITRVAGAYDANGERLDC